VSFESELGAYLMNVSYDRERWRTRRIVPRTTAGAEESDEDENEAYGQEKGDSIVHGDFNV